MMATSTEITRCEPPVRASGTRRVKQSTSPACVSWGGHAWVTRDAAGGGGGGGAGFFGAAETRDGRAPINSATATMKDHLCAGIRKPLSTPPVGTGYLWAQ